MGKDVWLQNFLLIAAPSCSGTKQLFFFHFQGKQLLQKVAHYFGEKDKFSVVLSKFSAPVVHRCLSETCRKAD